MTISNSSHPSANACFASATFAAVVVAPSGNPMTVHTGTRPPRYSTARSTQHGLMQMDAVLFSNASSQIRRMSSQPASAFSSVWSTFANISCFVIQLLFSRARGPSVSICSARTGRFSLLYPFSLRRARKPKAGQPQPPRPFALESNYFTSVTTTAFTGISVRAISLLSASTFLRMSEAMLFVLFCSAANSVS